MSANASSNAPAAPRGKIGRLPAALRDQVNRRLENNETAETLLAWLNQLPETRRVIKDQFKGAPITPQNLSEWRQGGYRQWLLLQELLNHADRLNDALEDAATHLDPPTLADNLATVLAARYAALLNDWDGEVTPEFEAKVRLLRGLTRDIVQLQKALHRAADRQDELAAAEDESEKRALQESKEASLAEYKIPDRFRLLASCYGEDAARAMVAIESARSIPELISALNRIDAAQPAQSDSIQPDPTISAPTPSPATLNTENQT